MEDEECSTAVFYVRVFAIVALILLLGFMFRPYVFSSYNWVMELKEGPATFIVGVLGFGGLLIVTIYNGMETRKNLREEKLHQARNNAVILDVEVATKHAAILSFIQILEESNAEEVQQKMKTIFNIGSEIFDKFTCELDKEYLSGFSVHVVRHITITAASIASLKLIGERMASEEHRAKQIARKNFIEQGHDAVNRLKGLVAILKADYGVE